MTAMLDPPAEDFCSNDDEPVVEESEPGDFDAPADMSLDEPLVLGAVALGALFLERFDPELLSLAFLQAASPISGTIKDIASHARSDIRLSPSWN